MAENEKTEATCKTKSKSSYRHYCCVCSNYRGKVVDGRNVTLHRFPADKSVQNVWLQRIKLVSPSFRFNPKNDRLCSEHFCGGVFPDPGCKRLTIPSVFMLHDGRKKTFGYPESNWQLNSPSSGSDVIDHMDCSDTDDSEYENPAVVQPYEMPNEHLSLLYHNYHTMQPPNIDAGVMISKLCKSVQTTTTSGSFAHKSTGTDDTDQSFIKPTSNRNLVSQSTQTDLITQECCCQKTTVSKPDVKTQSVGIQVVKPDLTFEDISDSDEMCMFYTGIPNAGTFNLLFNEMSDAEQHTHRAGSGENQGRPRILRLIDEFFLVLMRLRLGLLLQDLAHRFHVSKSTCSNITNQWISYLSVKLAFLTPWPPQSIIQKTLPNKFRRKYPDCRVIIDCTEIYTETPQSLVNKSLMYSHYKSHMTYKALLGISPSGIITFSSDLWAGSISDKQLTVNCGLLDLCASGDAIMADKGFLISDLTTPRGIRLIIPPLKRQRFNRQQVEETRRIANYRIDVERAMERVKNFRILQGVMPINISHQATKIWKLCVCLSNLLPPLIQDNEE